MSFIILDRDGVINYDSDEYIKSPEECLPIPGSLQAISLLNRAGYKIYVATNQSGIGRGYYDLAMLDLIHEKLRRELAKVGGVIDDFFFCPHLPDDNCLCRKPKPGLLHQIERKYAIDLGKTFFIGDSYVDVKAAQNAGALPILVLTGNGRKAMNDYPELEQIPNFEDLVAAVDFVLTNGKK